MNLTGLSHDCVAQICAELHHSRSSMLKRPCFYSCVCLFAIYRFLALFASWFQHCGCWDVCGLELLLNDFPTKKGSASLITAALHQILPLKCNAEVCDCFYTRVTHKNIILCFLILKSSIALEAVSLCIWHIHTANVPLSRCVCIWY